ncbi:MAG: transketolase [Rhizobiaceae bacterium]
MSSRQNHDMMANAIRSLAIDGVEAAKSGHPGLPLGAADVATVLFSKHLKFDASNPKWADRDRFVLSAGHGSMLIYSLLHLTGYEGVTLDQLKRFRQLGSNTAGHPEWGHTPGVETTTGPLGQGIATAVGMALAERMLNAEYGKKLVDHYTYVLASDGDLMEGVSQEAIAIAGHLKLSRMIVLWDDNGISIDGPLSISDSVDQIKRFQSAGWRAERVDGHDPDAISAALDRAKKSSRPTLIACKTIIGFGSPKRAGTSKAHGEPLGVEEAAATKAKLGLSGEAFAIDPKALKAWRATGAQGADSRKEWEARLASLSDAKRAEFTRRMTGVRSPKIGKAVAAHIKGLLANPQTVATRKASELALDAIKAVMPELVSGSADLTPSNNTKAKGFELDVSAKNFKGRYIRWGIREHGMCAAMSGIALHGGLVPAGGTFMVFTDYARPAIRLASLMGIGVTYVMTHDSIGLGEDGPTHQPVEHLAALRCIPNLRTFRPCDTIETAECWQLALERTDGPTVLCLSRQNLPQLRATAKTNQSAGGAYELLPAEGGKAQVSIFASGSEVEIAVNARKLLAEKGVHARVVSVPSMDLFLAQDEATRKAVIGTAPVRIAVEAGLRFGWDAIIGEHGLFVGMTGFGASAPAKDLFKHFGITAEALVDKVMARHNH